MKHKKRILELRKKGYSYNRIASTLNCSKGTIAYHCGEGVKEKTHQRTQRQRDDDFLFRRACEDWGLQNDKDWFRKGVSKRKKVVEELRGVIKELIPKTTRTLKILLPTTLLAASESLPFKIELKLTSNSGELVPRETTVKPITI